ncbi:glycosyltransferase family 4 protein [Serratia proteamaculans]|uniref:glycosyltransferase family 4 protein n=1 Tax=Serratia proteamaculans TaxID=28151 RepID=UPI00124A1F96|nr:glycosyltransferase family 4 protein [Serratia proteamaculans]KAB1496479.1 glycosyltransferase family 4 protein [Serratia proteamaculans]CAI0895819.1 UDP-D-galactose:(glucosyl)lipopolysaccharide-1,6-D-galactosyltransferase [Serratia proteamaculans]CAI0955773.1 UDP-D-galactose:(glucosyl)lipopolysaccharide-1,6-D-galactosyltransferase [Serratia proteamaculans]CAI0959719.1 UDP-D-galactose:(glucosyl)lipopolysaccharide-1,6-D-galactosyltransferase [Serratia proteamaculans]CAI2087476.1 UDP-D-galact
MLKDKKIAIVFTASIVGGHELMAVEHIKKFNRKGFSITCYIPKDNNKLKAIFKLNNIDFISHKVVHRKLESIQSFINPIFVLDSLMFLHGVNKTSDEIVIIQGDIELGAGFINAAKLIGYPIVSYIPYAHDFDVMGSKFSKVKNLLSNILYRNCQRYITISHCFKSEIISKNKKSVVKVIRNFVSEPPIQQVRGKGYFFERKDGVLKLLMAGRVYFRQKGQDLLIEALRGIDQRIELTVIGDGPDLKKLITLASTLPKNITVTFLGWKDNVWDYAQDIDLILIPSNFEGVPLIMLEAMKRNVPVIASARDGMADYLERKSLYDVAGVTDEVKIMNLRNKIKEFAEVE